jgi:hypothetical protein
MGAWAGAGKLLLSLSFGSGILGKPSKTDRALPSVGGGIFRREVNVAFTPNSYMELDGWIAADRRLQRCPDSAQKEEEGK